MSRDRIAPTVWGSLLLLSCVGGSTAPGVSPGMQCGLHRTLDAAQVVECLYAKHVIGPSDRQLALDVFTSTSILRDSLRGDTAIANFERAAELTRALQRVGDFYARGLFADSARFHRMIDHVLVTVEYVRGTSIRWISGRGWPTTTPCLSWAFYPNIGIYFQPVNTIQSVAYLVPRTNVTTDSLLTMGEQFYRYALWRESGGRGFPVWEYLLTWNSGGVVNYAPWISGLAQSYALIIFAENYRRTGNPMWKRRAFDVLTSFKVMWDDGGVLLPDTIHGYWWEEYHPVVRVWNGAAQAVLGVGQLWRATGEVEVRRLFDRGIEALKYYTPEYDTGYWTLYSRTQGYCTLAYHNSHIQIMDALYALSGDPWFKEVADRWRAYVPPPGVG